MKDCRCLLLAVAFVAASAGSRSPARAQTATINGRVSGDASRPVGTANVFISELNISVSTTADGRYTIIIPANRIQNQVVILRARAIGYVAGAAEITISAGSQVQDFILRRDINRLETVVVTGTVTGTEQKKLPFNVVTLDTTDLPVLSVNPLRMLQGKVPGAYIVQSSGRPGNPPAVILRGPKSLDASGRSQEPLYIVDGVLLNSGMQELSADDIETIEVVKGAAASSLYGSRAGAGVIQITTKRPKKGAETTSFTIRSEFGASDLTGSFNYPKRHFLVMDERNERFCVRGAAAGVTGQPPCTRTVDFAEEVRRINESANPWADLPYAFERDYSLSAPTRVELKGLFQVNRWPKEYNALDALTQRQLFATNTVDLSAASGSSAYVASLSNVTDKGAMRFVDGYRRTSGRLNVSHNLGDVLAISFNSSFARSSQDAAFSGGPTFGNSFADIERIFQGTRLPAGVNPLQRDSRGRLYVRSNPLANGGENQNILYDFENQDGFTNVDHLTASVQTRYTPRSWLTFDATASTDRRRQNGQLFYDRGYRTVAQPTASGNQFWGEGFIDQTSLNDLSENLALGAKASFESAPRWRGALTARYTYEQQDADFSEESGYSLTVPGVKTLANATNGITISSNSRSVRAVGALTGAQIELNDRYIADALFRYDGSSLFGSAERWHPYGRGSLAWRISEEPFWKLGRVANEFKLRASVGTAGGRPSFSSQYETFVITTGGGVGANSQQGNKSLKPETTFETEFGIDAELFSRIGLTVTYARDITRNQLLPIPAPAASGFPFQWTNAGTLDGKTWELSLRVPIVQRSQLKWNSQISWDRNRTHITALDRDPFQLQSTWASNGTGNGVRFYYAPGERYGTMWGWQYATRCSQLPPPFDMQCGAGKEWQTNDEGYIVWVGSGHAPSEGVTLNLWQTIRPGCMKNGLPLAAVHQQQCQQLGGTVNAPFGAETHWGMPTLLRDSVGQPVFGRLGSVLPDYHLSMSHTVQWGRLSAYALLDRVAGNKIFNQERQWSYLSFQNAEVDQVGKTPENAKPIGYYWRASPPQAANGVGGFYGQLVANNRTVEDGSYTKLREVSLSYKLGDLRFARAWTISIIGRNLYTRTRYSGWDPEGGISGGASNSAALTPGGFFQYPQTRSVTLALKTTF